MIDVLSNIIYKIKSLFVNHEDEFAKKNKNRDVFKKIDSNYNYIKDKLAPSNDLVVRKTVIEKNKFLIIYIDGMIDKETINDNILQELMNYNFASSEKNIYQLVKKEVISVGEVKTIKTLDKAIESILAGDTVVFIDGYSKSLVASTKGWQGRGVEKPTTETSIRGPKESFTETLRTNTSLLRRKIKNDKLKFESLNLGEVTKTQISLSYLEGVSNPKLVKEVKKRLGRIEVDSILDSEYIKELINDAPLSPFPTIYETERPDTVASKLLEGKIVILVDGAPEALVLPVVFMEHLLDASDYYQNYFFATITRTLRLISLFITLLLPPLYVAIIDYHPEMLPTPLIISFNSARSGVPFPPVVEAILMGLLFEILREAGLRMPRNVGQAVSVVGALIIGEAAVNAGLVSTPMVIVAALTGLTIFTIPSSDLALTFIPIRLLFTILAAVLGLFGIMLGLLVLIIHLASLRSLGVPYLSPIAPMNFNAFKDVFARAPWWGMNHRPKINGYNQGDRVRQSPGQKPEEPKDKEKEAVHEEK